MIYRVAQEALTNVLRHAQLLDCLVSLQCSGQLVELAIQDDGRGLPQDLAGQTVRHRGHA